MNRPNLMDAGQSGSDPSLETVPVRSYREIARVLAEREGIALTQARVGQLCRSAELKLVRILMADPLVRARLRFRAERNR